MSELDRLSDAPAQAGPRADADVEVSAAKLPRIDEHTITIRVDDPGLFALSCALRAGEWSGDETIAVHQPPLDDTRVISRGNSRSSSSISIGSSVSCSLARPSDVSSILPDASFYASLLTHFSQRGQQVRALWPYGHCLEPHPE
jgi:hypothetical protein